MQNFIVWYAFIFGIFGIVSGEFINVLNDDMSDFNALLAKEKITIDSVKELIDRLNNFHLAKSNLKQLEKDHPGVTFELNRYALMSKDELKQFLNADMTDNGQTDSSHRTKRQLPPFEPYPESFDWRDYGKVSPVKYQGSCGSCWAFAILGAVESQYLIRYNKTLNLSEQQLVTCNTEAFPNTGNGCAGGYMRQGFIYTQNNGIPLETCHPYTQKANISKCDVCTEKYHIDGFSFHSRAEFDKLPSTRSIAWYLYKFGPPTVTMYVNYAFMYYKSGIFQDPIDKCGPNAKIGTHAMVLVGYTPDYWIIKNSWGTTWGENGYVRIKRGLDVCHITWDLTTPFLEQRYATVPSPSPIPTTTTITTSTTSATTTTTSASLPTDDTIKTCKEGWEYYSPTKACYRYIAGGSRNLIQAEQNCTLQGAHLVSLHSAGEDVFVRGLIPPGTDRILIGYNNYSWTDGSPVDDYGNWELAVAIDQCAAMYSPDFKWKSVGCAGAFAKFVCKYHP